MSRRVVHPADHCIKDHIPVVKLSFRAAAYEQDLHPPLNMYRTSSISCLSVTSEALIDPPFAFGGLITIY